VLDQQLVVLRSVREGYNNRLNALKNLRSILNSIEAELRGMELKEIEDALKKEEKVQPFLTTIGSLTSHTENWVIHARVVEKTDVKRWDMNRTSGQLFHVVLEDNTGAIRATIFDTAVEKLYYVFEVGKQYAISNGKIRRKADYTFEMTISETAVITLITPDPVMVTPLPSVQFQVEPPEQIAESKSARSPSTTPIRSILKIPSVSDEEDILGPPTSNRGSNTGPPKSILKNSGDEDHLYSEFDNSHTRFRGYRDLEETEEEDHGFKIIKKVGFKDTEKDSDHPVTPKRVGFKELEDEEIKPSTSSPPSARGNQLSSSSGGQPTLRWGDYNKIIESDSGSSAERYSPAPPRNNTNDSTDLGGKSLDRKKKSVSFRTPSDDEEDVLQQGGAGEGGITPETEKKTFNLKKYFG